jgi:hypothetical protein
MHARRVLCVDPLNNLLIHSVVLLNLLAILVVGITRVTSACGRLDRAGLDYEWAGWLLGWGCVAGDV